MIGVMEVIAVADRLKGVLATVSTINKRRREKLASLFEKISQLLETYQENRKLGIPSPGLCAKLKQYANAISKVGSRAMTPPELDRLVQELREVCETIQNPPAGSSYEKELDKLAEGAGTFLGCAEVLRLQ